MEKIEFLRQIDCHQSKLFGFAMTLTKNGEDAKDLMQEATYKAFKNLKQFKAGSNFKAWMAMIIRNAFINKYRKDKRKNDFEHNFESVPKNYITRKVIYNEGMSNSMVSELKAIINELNEDLRRPFLLNYSGFKYEEIAKKMDLPLGTVKSKIHHARKQLKQKIKKAYQVNHFSEMVHPN